MPGSNSSAYRWVPNWLGICWFAIASTVAWIWLCGMLGVNTYTLGPRSGVPATCVAGVTAGLASAVLTAA